jgi:hypothetical protein
MMVATHERSSSSKIQLMQRLQQVLSDITQQLAAGMMVATHERSSSSKIELVQRLQQVLRDDWFEPAAAAVGSAAAAAAASEQHDRPQQAVPQLVQQQTDGLAS